MITKASQVKSHWVPTLKQVERIIKAVLKSEKIRLTGDLAVIFVDNKMIRKLNKQFLNEPHNTDVIAFPYEDDDFLGNQQQNFGDIYISIDEAKANAKKFKEPVRREVVRLIVHGTLHLLGYDDHAPRDKKIMWEKQEKLVQNLYKRLR